GLLQCDVLVVPGKAVEVRPVLGREALELVERALLLEDLSVALESERGIEDAGATASALLRLACVRRAVGAEENISPARDRSLAHCQTVFFALCHRKTVSVGAQPAGEQSVAINHQMLRRDRRCDVWALPPNKINGVRGRNVLQNDLQAREVA